jgi:hypothetical protein
MHKTSKKEDRYPLSYAKVNRMTTKAESSPSELHTLFASVVKKRNSRLPFGTQHPHSAWNQSMCTDSRRPDALSLNYEQITPQHGVVYTQRAIPGYELPLVVNGGSNEMIYPVQDQVVTCDPHNGSNLRTLEGLVANLAFGRSLQASESVRGRTTLKFSLTDGSSLGASEQRNFLHDPTSLSTEGTVMLFQTPFTEISNTHGLDPHWVGGQSEDMVLEDV